MRAVLLTRLAATGILAICSGTLYSQSIESLPPNRLATLCWPELIRLDTYTRSDPIPVGCELVDCCPGCRRPDLLDWRIRLEGGPVESAELEFDNLAPRSVAALPFEDGKLRIGKGESLIRGLPTVATGLPPVGRLRLIFNAQWGAKEIEQAADREMPVDARDADDIVLTVEQLLGNVVVNEYALKYHLRHCAPHKSDKIVLTNNIGNDSAVILLDARRKIGRITEDCVDDLDERGSSSVDVGLLMKKRGCRSEIAAFSDDNAMALVENVGIWTKENNDVLTMNLKPRLIANVVVWLARPNALTEAQNELAEANRLYNLNNVGIGFNLLRSQDVTANTAALATIGLNCAGNSTALSQSAFFQANTLNVYYVANGSITGENCLIDRNIQYIGTIGALETLAHELGHSMGLRHTDAVPGFSTANLMWPQLHDRTHLSEGQAFRLSVHCGSTINTNGTRAGAVGVELPPPPPVVRNCANTIPTDVACPDTVVDDHCPRLALDVQPK